jgi:cytochrome c biogenesis protein CcdA
MKKKNWRSNLEVLKELDAEERESYEHAAKQIADEVYGADDFELQVKKYNRQKKMKWWSYLTSFGIAIGLTLVAVIIGLTTSWHVSNYYDYGVAVSFVIVLMILAWSRNRYAARFFNDKRKRYQRTLTLTEAETYMWLKTILLALFLFMPTLISLAVIYK